jgi:hypothetical protein
MRKLVTHQITIAGKVYPRGVHDFPETVMAHEHFKHYVKAGRIQAPAAPSALDKLKTDEALAKRKEMEERFGVPRKAVAAPSSLDTKVEPIGDSGFEPKVAEPEAEAEEQSPESKAANKKPKR